MAAQPKQITSSNLRNFFSYQPAAPVSLKPGMLINFRYSSPDGIHDPRPLVYVLSKEGDRVWGLNLHYKFQLLAQLYNFKSKEVKAGKKEIKPTTQTPSKEQPKVNPLDKLPKLKKVLAKTKTRVKPSLSKPKMAPMIKAPQQQKFKTNVNLEVFTLQQKPEYILRNYLFSRMKHIQKLIFKVV